MPIDPTKLSSSINGPTTDVVTPQAPLPEAVKPTGSVITDTTTLNAITESGATPLPPIGRPSLGSPDRDIPRVNGNDLVKLLNRKYETPFTGVRLYHDIGDHFELNEKGHYAQDADGRYTKTSKGISSWVDLISFVPMAAEVAGDVRELQFAIELHNMPTLDIPEWVITDLKALSNKLSKGITLKIVGDPLDPPTILRINAGETLDGNITALIQEDNVQTFIKASLSPAQKLLLNALQQAHVDNGSDSWGNYLQRAIDIYNVRAESAQVPVISPTKRTVIYSLLAELEGTTQEILKNYLASQSETTVTQGINLIDAVYPFRLAHPVTDRQDNCWFSVGAGQMIATLEFARHLMDIGVLPLDFRLMGNDLNEGLIQEINNLGTNRFFLGDVPVNPQGRKPIYIINDRQRDAALRKYTPEVILVNLKASLLGVVFNSGFIDIIKDFSPVLAAPAKAYDNQGKLPYLEVIGKIIEAGYQSLAEAFVVMGGFFAAPDILKQDIVDMTLAAGNSDTLARIRKGMSPTAADIRGRANWDQTLNLKLVPSTDLAASLMAGGANKNLLTYRSGRKLMDEAITEANKVLKEKEEISQSAADRIIRGINVAIEDEAANNIEVSEEITARYMAAYPLTTGLKLVADHLWSPEGLKQDFINCLPRSGGELLTIATRLHKIIADQDTGALKELIEEVRIKLGRGTRNARDGYIDSIIKEAHEKWTESGFLTGKFDDFYANYYPKIWTGKGAQEGRNGIGPLLAFALQHHITLPSEVYEAWNLYNPHEPIKIAGEKVDTVKLVEGVNKIWGLSQAWVDSVFVALNKLKENLARLSSHGQRPSSRFFLKGLNSLVEVVERKPTSGAIPEVQRRLDVIHKRLKTLVTIFEENDIKDDLSTNAANQFSKTVKHMLKLQEETNLTSLLNKLRHAAQDLYRVELKIKEGLAQQLDLEPDDPSSGPGNSGEFRLNFSPTDTGTFQRIGDPQTTSTQTGPIVEAGPNDSFGDKGPIMGLVTYLQPTIPKPDAALFDGALALKPQIEYVPPPKTKLALVDDTYKPEIKLKLGTAANDDVELADAEAPQDQRVDPLALGSSPLVGLPTNVIPFGVR